MHARTLLAAALLLTLALAGCSGGKDGSGKGSASDDDLGDLPMLHGYVVDAAIRPLEGVTVKVIDTNVSTETNEGGYFGLDDLPTEQFLVIVASKPGFLPQSKQVTLVPDMPVRLNFSLNPEPIKTAFERTLQFEGFIGCQIASNTPSGNNSINCGDAAGNPGTAEKARWDFSVDADLAGAVIEVFWEPTTQAGTTLGLRLETLELGQLNVVLGETVGPTPLQVTVPQSAAEKYYSGGGLMRLTMYAQSDSDQNEAGVGMDVVAQQGFQAFASLFYVEPPPAGYTIDT
jgi:hypothetical protein